MAQTINYVSEQRLLYFTQKIKEKFPTAADFIDDVTASLSTVYSSSKVDSLLTGKVNVEEGKGLSTNDFTDDYKNAIDNLDLTSLIDDSATDALDKTWSAKKIMDTLGGFVGISFVKVDSLPETGSAGIIYLVPSSSAISQNAYDEYFWVAADNSFEFLGTTAIDLSGYVKSEDLAEITTEQIDSIFTTVWGA